MRLKNRLIVVVFPARLAVFRRQLLVTAVLELVDDGSTQAQIAPSIQKLKTRLPIWIGATIESMQSLGSSSGDPLT